MYVVGIAGGTGSGKSTVASALAEQVGEGRVVILAHDAYYRDLSHLLLEERAGVNFDHPDALETELLVAHLDTLGRGETVRTPVYDFSVHTRRTDAFLEIAPRPVVIVEGVLVLADEVLRERMDLKIYVDAGADERLMRRLERDVVERGRTQESVMAQYRETVRPMHEQFVEPSKQFADLILPGEGGSRAGVELLAAHLENEV
ncbi:MAG: uridine kinase [bacterium]|nr:uridine kinase [bacterium]